MARKKIILDEEHAGLDGGAADGTAVATGALGGLIAAPSSTSTLPSSLRAWQPSSTRTNKPSQAKAIGFPERSPDLSTWVAAQAQKQKAQPQAQEPPKLEKQPPSSCDFVMLKKLNDDQLRAVLHEGSLMVLAAAGSGKTATCIARVGHLMYQGLARPSEIVVVTFTKKAATELRDRVTMLGGPGGPLDMVSPLTGDKVNLDELQIGTFHSLGLRVIREYLDQVTTLLPTSGDPAKDYPFSGGRAFRVIGSDEQKQVVKALLEREFPKACAEKGSDALTRRAVGLFNQYKEQGLLPLDVWRTACEAQAKKRSQSRDRESWAGTTLWDRGLPEYMYVRYCETMEQAQRLDFADILLRSLRLLQRPPIQARLQARFRHLLVDEFQDTNDLQYQWLMHLSGRAGSGASQKMAPSTVFAVGDDDQSIYAFRGARPKNMTQFQTDFKAPLLMISMNYRSLSHITRAANGLIERNTDRQGKVMKAHQQSRASDKLLAVTVLTEKDQAEMIADMACAFMEQEAPWAKEGMAALSQKASLLSHAISAGEWVELDGGLGALNVFKEAKAKNAASPTAPTSIPQTIFQQDPMLEEVGDFDDLCDLSDDGGEWGNYDEDGSFIEEDAGPEDVQCEITTAVENSAVTVELESEQGHVEVPASTPRGSMTERATMAILYRVNGQSRLIEEALSAQNIPYQIKGAFYERPEVIVFAQMIRVILSGMSLPRPLFDRLGLEPGGMETEAALLSSMLSMEAKKPAELGLHLPLHTAALQSQGGGAPVDAIAIASTQARLTGAWVETLSGCQEVLRVGRIEDPETWVEPRFEHVVRDLMIQSGLYPALVTQARQRVPGSQQRLDVLDSLIEKAGSIEVRYLRDFEPGSARLLETVAHGPLESDDPFGLDGDAFEMGAQADVKSTSMACPFGPSISSLARERRDAFNQRTLRLITQLVSELTHQIQWARLYATAQATSPIHMMTVHASKGLEFDMVVLAGLCEGIFPHKMSIDAEAAQQKSYASTGHKDVDAASSPIDDERRLAYVAITRARRHFIATNFAEATGKSKGGVFCSASFEPSRFIQEIPADVLALKDLSQRPRQDRALFAKEAIEMGRDVKNQSTPQLPSGEASSEDASATVSPKRAPSR